MHNSIPESDRDLGAKSQALLYNLNQLQRQGVGVPNTLTNEVFVLVEKTAKSFEQRARLMNSIDRHRRTQSLVNAVNNSHILMKDVNDSSLKSKLVATAKYVRDTADKIKIVNLAIRRKNNECAELHQQNKDEEERTKHIKNVARIMNSAIEDLRMYQEAETAHRDLEMSKDDHEYEIQILRDRLQKNSTKEIHIRQQLYQFGLRTPQSYADATNASKLAKKKNAKRVSDALAMQAKSYSLVQQAKEDLKQRQKNQGECRSKVQQTLAARKKDVEQKLALQIRYQKHLIYWNNTISDIRKWEQKSKQITGKERTSTIASLKEDKLKIVAQLVEREKEIKEISEAVRISKTAADKFFKELNLTITDASHDHINEEKLLVDDYNKYVLKVQEDRAEAAAYEESVSQSKQRAKILEEAGVRNEIELRQKETLTEKNIRDYEKEIVNLEAQQKVALKYLDLLTDALRAVKKISRANLSTMVNKLAFAETVIDKNARKQWAIPKGNKQRSFCMYKNAVDNLTPPQFAYTKPKVTSRFCIPVVPLFLELYPLMAIGQTLFVRLENAVATLNDAIETNFMCQANAHVAVQRAELATEYFFENGLHLRKLLCEVALWPKYSKRETEYLPADSTVHTLLLRYKMKISPILYTGTVQVAGGPDVDTDVAMYTSGNMMGIKYDNNAKQNLRFFANQNSQQETDTQKTISVIRGQQIKSFLELLKDNRTLDNYYARAEWLILSIQKQRLGKEDLIINESLDKGYEKRECEQLCYIPVDFKPLVDSIYRISERNDRGTIKNVFRDMKSITEKNWKEKRWSDFVTFVTKTNEELEFRINSYYATTNRDEFATVLGQLEQALLVAIELSQIYIVHTYKNIFPFRFLGEGKSNMHRESYNSALQRLPYNPFNPIDDYSDGMDRLAQYITFIMVALVRSPIYKTGKANALVENAILRMGFPVNFTQPCLKLLFDRAGKLQQLVEYLPKGLTDKFTWI
jgi:hypothetical protein